MDTNIPSAVLTSSKADKRVLIVEDEAAVVWKLIRSLSRVPPFADRMVPDWVTTGREALQRVMELRYELILLDWELPGQESVKLLRALQDHRIDTLVIVVSKHSFAKLSPELAGFTVGFVSKNELNEEGLQYAFAMAHGKLFVQGPIPKENRVSPSGA